MPITYPTQPGFKAHATETSANAALEQAASADTLRAECLAELRRCPATADEIAAALGRSVLSVRPRISELVALGKATATADRRQNASGKSAVVWRAVVALKQVELIP